MRPPAHAAIVHKASEGLDVRVVLKKERGLRKMVVERGGEVEDGMGLARPDVVPSDAERPFPSAQRRRHCITR
jgi:hypothetical protein